MLSKRLSCIFSGRRSRVSVEELLRREGRELAPAEGWSTRTVLLVAGTSLLCGSMLAVRPPSGDVPDAGERVVAGSPTAPRQPHLAAAGPDRLATVHAVAPEHVPAAPATSGARTAPAPSVVRTPDGARPADTEGVVSDHHGPATTRHPSASSWFPFSGSDPGWSQPDRDHSEPDRTGAPEPDGRDDANGGSEAPPPDSGSDEPSPDGPPSDGESGEARPGGGADHPEPGDGDDTNRPGQHRDQPRGDGAGRNAEEHAEPGGSDQRGNGDGAGL
jgi:hypothetical protein